MSPLLNAEQAAALLSVPKSWVLAQAREDKIPHVRLGRYVRFDANALEEWARQATRGPRRDKRGKEA
jgi:excisionase family DNA binding protein